MIESVLPLRLNTHAPGSIDVTFDAGSTDATFDVPRSIDVVYDAPGSTDVTFDAPGSTDATFDAPRATQVAFDASYSHKKEVRRKNKAESSPSKVYFLCYCFVYASNGIFAALPSVLFTQITHQLDVSNQKTSYIMILGNIGYIASCLLTAAVLDRFEKTHKGIALFMLCAGVSCICIPFATKFWTQCLLWPILGMTQASKGVSVVYVFRQWNDNPTTVLISLWAVFSIGMLLTPLLIELCLYLTDEYYWAMILLSINPLSAALLLMKLPTPLHDARRSIEKQMARRQSTRELKQVQLDLESHSNLKTFVEISLVSLGVVYGILVRGCLLNITVYCEEYLGVSAGIGRFLISSYSGAQILLRILKASLRGSSFEQYLNSSRMSWAYLWIAQISMMLMFGVWFVVPFEHKVPALFVLFASAGFVMGDYGTSLPRLIEEITPVLGRHSFSIGALFSCGVILILSVNGEVIERYGVEYYPLVLLATSSVGVPLLVTSMITYRLYRNIQKDVMRDDVKRESEVEPIRM